MHKKIKVLIVIGTRPNYMKISKFKLLTESKYNSIQIKILHTGQHYDKNLSSNFFKQLGFEPDYLLDIKGSSAVGQLSEIILEIERITKNEFSPDLILVPGDVNSTLAGALAANKLGIPLGHIESGLRSFDREMPEEINRIITDELSSFFFVSEPSGVENLINEGKNKDSIFFVGNTMIDSMILFEKEIESVDISHIVDATREYGLVTLHRPSNVDKKEDLIKILDLLNQLTQYSNIVFPMHPRTTNSFENYNLMNKLENINGLKLTKSLDYFSFQKLVKMSLFVLTDSGGIQEETTFLGKKCFTLRNNTERPITIESGSNELLEFNIDLVIKKIREQTLNDVLVPENWDGKSTDRILDIILELFKSKIN